MSDKIIIEPIGYIETEYLNRDGVPAQGRDSNNSYGAIVIKAEFLEGILDLKPGDKLTVIFNFHKSNGFELTTIPCKTNNPVGVFSTRSPDRPNSLGISLIEVIHIEDNVIKFKGADMLNGTPVIDIKPFI